MITCRVPTVFFAVLLASTTAGADRYDPLVLPTSVAAEPLDLTVHDPTRGRDVPVRVYLPVANQPAPVILVSHGLGGTRAGSAYLGQHWSARGYVVVYLQHPGSDDSVWRDQPEARRMDAMNRAISLQNFILRVKDVVCVLDQFDAWNQKEDHRLFRRLDRPRVGMSGHSFGAATTQAVSGQSVGLVGQRYTDRRIRAALALSPSNPRRGDPAAAFASVEIPWMLMTGTKDTAPIGNIDAASRLDVFPNLPATIDKFELVLHNAEHSAFTDRALPGDQEKRNPNHHRAILALSTAFWDTYLRDDAAARQWLLGAGPRSVLEKDDRWQPQTAREDR